MATSSIKQLPLVVIVGPTASGKTTLAIEIAEKFSGEVICADSRTVYRYMDIGTAKPTEKERARVPHWGLDLVEPGERFTVADFKQYAVEKIQQIRTRGHTPFLVGGSGLYIDAVLFDYQFGEPQDKALHQRFEKMNIDELHQYCVKNSVSLPENMYNKRYIIRAIEQKGINTKIRSEPAGPIIIVGIATKKDELRDRIEQRTEQLFKNNVVNEATLLGKKYGWNSEAMTANIYPLLYLYLENKITLEEVKDKFTTADWQLAKKQLTWFKRNPYIVWLELQEAKAYFVSLLANK